ncbi:MAG: polysaccharide biosynthesis C-terminal domain-containing protein, partial [Candidatus Babeliales bacterium]|nr:polysaccharide biosynthesis C-terminal domain-containing protein [Candidatus Babeliales bacterium]
GRKQIINDIISIYLVIATPIFIFTLMSVNYINKVIFINEATNAAIYISLIICFMHFFIELFFQVFRYQEKAKTLVMLQVIMGSINLLFAIILIYFLNYKIEGIIFANLISILLICAYALYLYFKKINSLRFNISKDKAKIFYYLKLGLPFIPSIIFSWVLSFADRWILAHYKTFAEVGIYSLADSFAQLFNAIILLPIISSYQPYILKKFAENKNRILEIDNQNIKNMCMILIVTLALLISGFLIFKNILYWILPIKFHEAINYILILLIGQVFFLGSQFATCLLVYLRKSYILMYIMIISACTNLFLNYMLIHNYSTYGCSVATAISYFIYLILILMTNIILKRNLP